MISGSPTQHSAAADTDSEIHPTAYVHPNAEIGEAVTIGPFSLIEANTQIGDRCKIGGHVQLLNSTSLGEDCVVSGGAILGGDPQDLQFDPEKPSRVEIGNRNTIREHVTIHRGAQEDGVTRVGDDNYLMVNSHLGHDVVLGNKNILANGCLLGGVVHVGDNNFLGGGSAVHQFVRIGNYVMVKGLSAISKDIPPFVTVHGHNQISGLNVIGLRRAGFSASKRGSIKLAFDHMYRSGLNITQALDEAAELVLEPEAQRFIDFFRAPSAKGVCTR